MLPWSARSVVLTSLLGTLGAIPAYGGAYFLGLNSVEPGVTAAQAYGVSYDGSVITGFARRDGTNFAYVLRDGHFTDLGTVPGGGGLMPRAVSADGTVVVGDRSYTSGGSEGFRWTVDTGVVGLGASSSSGNGVSADGNVIVGGGSDGAFRWTPSTGFVILPSFGWPGNVATDISADASTIVGTAVASPWFQAFRWTEATGMIGLGDFAGGDFNSQATGVSADGSVVVGFGTKGSGHEAFRWTPETGLVGLGDLPGGRQYSIATDVSADGSIVVGLSSASSEFDRPFVWDANHGLRPLSQYLSLEHGLDLTGWTLMSARVSGDGQTFVGQAFNPAGSLEAYIAHVPEPASILFLCAGILGLRRRRPSVSS